MKTYREEHGKLPIELPDFQEEKTKGKPASSSSRGAARRGTSVPKSKPPEAKVEPQFKADSSHQQPAAATVEQPSDEDIEQIHQAPILAPSRTNITNLREHLAKAFNGKDDLNMYISNVDFKAYTKSSKSEK
jgi:hypothetical protein